MGLRKESTTAILLDQCNALLHSESYPTPTEKGGCHSSSKTPHFTANGDVRETTTGHNAATDHGEPSPNRYITAPASVVQGRKWKSGQKDCKSQNTRKPTVKQSIIEMALDKDQDSGNISGHVNREGGDFQGPSLLKRTIGK